MTDPEDTNLTASQRFYAGIGRPHPGDLTPDELAEFERELDEFDAAIERRYAGVGKQP
jgi:hypothetical protein